MAATMEKGNQTMKRALFAALLLAPLASCGRGGAIESEPGPVYLLTVENPMSHPMDVWYDDGRETTELGRVEAGLAREFVIAAPASPSVEIVARDDGRTHTVTLPAELTRGAGARVVLTP
jgi:hypothetical protein